MRTHPISLALLACFSAMANADPKHCVVPLPEFTPDSVVKPGQIRVQADRAEIREDTVAVFDGKVDILSDNGQIKANQARINKNDQKLLATGDVSYRNPQILVNSDEVRLNTESGQLQMNDTRYRLALFNGRGQAEQIKLAKEEGIILEDVAFTTCPEGSEDWKIVASSIELEEGETWGEARNTRFFVKGVPVFYLPYFAFPVTDQRQTGLLWPEISSNNRTGITYEQPFYWNIAPNIDATISPRMMSKRGTQLNTQVRYLTEGHRGQINVEYLSEDKDTPNRDERYFYRFTHRGKLSEHWHINADINGLSDDNYIVDLGSDFYNRADTHLFQTLGVNYFTENLNFSATIRDFEVIGDQPSNYRALPEMKLFYQTDQFAGVEFRLNSELAHFDNTLSSEPTATRFHIAPSIAFPFQARWGELLAEASLLNTYYRQDNTEGTALEEEVNRTLGQARVYAALNFERETRWFGADVTQTLEPQVQYLFTSFEDQTNIGLYDTVLLLNDFNGIFRGFEFTGLDRISDNNQVTVGVTSRILDKNNREQFKVSIGQIFYLDDNQVLDAEKDDDRSAIATEVDWQLGSKWFAHSEIQIATSTEKVERSSLSLEYQLDPERIVQFTHRFVRDLSGERIDQLGVTASWPINNEWRWVGRWFKDMERNRTIESYTGLQYDSCCWSIRVVAQRNLTNRFDPSGFQSENEFDSGISLNFSFKFGAEARGTSTRDMLEDGLFGYRQPYLLNE